MIMLPENSMIPSAIIHNTRNATADLAFNELHPDNHFYRWKELLCRDTGSTSIK
jgi:hypothetical protein